MRDLYRTAEDDGTFCRAFFIQGDGEGVGAHRYGAEAEPQAADQPNKSILSDNVNHGTES